MYTSRTVYPPTYRGLTVGVNSSPRTAKLNFAEKDAQDIAALMASPIGPVWSEDVTCLTDITCSQLRSVLFGIAGESPAYLLFFFAGHGSPDGICLRDGLFRYDELAKWIAAIDAKSSLTLIDACNAAAYISKSAAAVGAIDEDALELLAKATPGNRVICSTGVDRTAGEGDGVANGHFTAAIIAAMMSAPGDMPNDGARWISDRALFGKASRLLTQKWGQVPYARRLTGDFPIVRDHRHVYGEACIAGIETHDDGLNLVFQVSVYIAGRQGLPTVVQAEALNQQGRPLAIMRYQLVAMDEPDVCLATFVLPRSKLLLDPISQIHLLRRHMAPVTWRVSIRDARLRLLDEGQEVVWYRSGTHPSMWAW